MRLKKDYNVLIIAGKIDYLNQLELNKSEYNFVIAADKGYEIGEALGLKVNLFIGDFDSSYLPNYHLISDKEQRVEILPEEKDLTDLEAALAAGAKMEPSKITIIGGLGGRLDHTLGNLSLLNKYVHCPFSSEIIDGKNRVVLKTPGKYIIYKKNFKYLSLIPSDIEVEGCSTEGAKYEIKNKTLTRDNTLGISNEILGSKCFVSFRKGNLFIVQSSD